jgi:pyridinium-3,5-biscarboxylic acid mononucleotide sulfurtransferase
MAESKLDILQGILKNMQSVLVAYSGGTDSSFLLKVAKDVLGDNVLAVTANSEIYSQVETENAKKIASEIGTRHIIVRTNELKNKEFVKNNPDRCFHCKLLLYSEFIKIATEHHLNQVIDGINLDDKQDFRPGISAAEKLKIRSPLLEAGFTKDEIRALSKEMNLSTWNKSPNPCLSTRFPYGTALLKENLSKVEQAEFQLQKFHFKQFRIRVHDNVARLEILPEDMEIALKEPARKEIVEILKKIGYAYITIDLEGYRTGSMNEKFRVRRMTS